MPFADRISLAALWQVTSAGNGQGMRRRTAGSVTTGELRERGSGSATSGPPSFELRRLSAWVGIRVARQVVVRHHSG